MHRRRSASLHCTLMGHNAATTTSRHNAATTTSPTMHATPRSHPVQQAHGLALLERGQRPGGVGQVLRAEVGQQAQRVPHQRLRGGRRVWARQKGEMPWGFAASTASGQLQIS